MRHLKQLILLLGDLSCLYAGLFLALAIRRLGLVGTQVAALIGPMTFLFCSAIIVLFIVGLYDIGRIKNSLRFFERLGSSAAIWTLLGIIFFYISPGQFVTPKTILALTAIFGFGFMAVWRFYHNRFISDAILKTNVVFIGLTDEVLETTKVLKNEQPHLGFNVLGIVDPNINNAISSLTAIPVYKTISELKTAFETAVVNIFIISPHLKKDETILRELYQQLYRQAEMVDLAEFYQNVSGRIPPFTFSEGWFLTNLHEQQKKIYDRFRMFVDYAAAVIVGVVCLATFPIVAIAIKLNSKGPVFFSQERVGRDGKAFKIYKYRTMMALNADGSAEIAGPVFAQNKDIRVTFIGKLLRKTRVDELPQFINMLKGDMSLVGPRPERPEFVRQLTTAMPFYALRLLVKPGLTGWAQLQHGYAGTIDENLRKLEYDLYYIKNRGPILDAVIILRTVNVVLRMAGR